ncbi:zinc-ribbon domain containing protein [Cohnella thermotolerans]
MGQTAECKRCGRVIVFDETNPDYYTSEGLQFPDKCVDCSASSMKNR